MAFTRSDKPEKVEDESVAPDRPLTAKEAAFAEEFLVDLNKARAAARAGFSAKTANVKGCQLYNDPRIRAAIDLAMAQRAERTQITVDMVLDRWWQIATADPNEIVSYRRQCCRHCFGIAFAYQWRDENEYAEALAKATDRQAKKLPTDDGGHGFDSTLPPHPKCPRCNGEGHGHTHVEDTRKLTGAARLLYAGMKEGREGIEAKMHDQMAALDKVARHLGVGTDKLDVNHSGSVTIKGGGVSGLLNAAKKANDASEPSGG